MINKFFLFLFLLFSFCSADATKLGELQLDIQNHYMENETFEYGIEPVSNSKMGNKFQLIIQNFKLVYRTSDSEKKYFKYNSNGAASASVSNSRSDAETVQVAIGFLGFDPKEHQVEWTKPSSRESKQPISNLFIDMLKQYHQDMNCKIIIIKRMKDHENIFGVLEDKKEEQNYYYLILNKAGNNYNECNSYFSIIDEKQTYEWNNPNAPESEISRTIPQNKQPDQTPALIIRSKSKPKPVHVTAENRAIKKQIIKDAEALIKNKFSLRKSDFTINKDELISINDQLYVQGTILQKSFPFEKAPKFIDRKVKNEFSVKIPLAKKLKKSKEEINYNSLGFSIFQLPPKTKNNEDLVLIEDPEAKKQIYFFFQNNKIKLQNNNFNIYAADDLVLTDLQINNLFASGYFTGEPIIIDRMNFEHKYENISVEFKAEDNFKPGKGDEMRFFLNQIEEKGRFFYTNDSNVRIALKTGTVNDYYEYILRIPKILEVDNAKLRDHPNRILFVQEGKAFSYFKLTKGCMFKDNKLIITYALNTKEYKNIEIKNIAGKTVKKYKLYVDKGGSKSNNLVKDGKLKDWKKNKIKIWNNPQINYSLLVQHDNYEDEVSPIDIQAKNIIVPRLKPKQITVEINFIDKTNRENANISNSKPESMTISRPKNIFPIDFILREEDQKYWEILDSEDKKIDLKNNESRSTIYKEIKIKRKTKMQSFRIAFDKKMEGVKLRYRIHGYEKEGRFSSPKEISLDTTDSISFTAKFPEEIMDGDKLSVSIVKPKGYDLYRGNNDMNWEENKLSVSWNNTSGQPKEVKIKKMKTFDFFYIDSSGDRNVLKTNNKLKELVEEIDSNNGEYLMYLSNKSNPLLAERGKEYEKLLNHIATHMQEPPNATQDRDAIISELKSKGIKPKRKIVTLHYFISKNLYDFSGTIIIDDLLIKLNTNAEELKIKVYQKSDFKVKENKGHVLVPLN